MPDHQFRIGRTIFPQVANSPPVFVPRTDGTFDAYTFAGFAGKRTNAQVTAYQETAATGRAAVLTAWQNAIAPPTAASWNGGTNKATLTFTPTLAGVTLDATKWTLVAAGLTQTITSVVALNHSVTINCSGVTGAAGSNLAVYLGGDATFVDDGGFAICPTGISIAVS